MFTLPAYVYKIKILKGHVQNLAYLESQSQSNPQYNDFDWFCNNWNIARLSSDASLSHTHWLQLIHVCVCCHSNINSEQEGTVLLPSVWRYRLSTFGTKNVSSQKMPIFLSALWWDVVFLSSFIDSILYLFLILHNFLSLSLAFFFCGLCLFYHCHSFGNDSYWFLMVHLQQGVLPFFPQLALEEASLCLVRLLSVCSMMLSSAWVSCFGMIVKALCKLCF